MVPLPGTARARAVRRARPRRRRPRRPGRRAAGGDGRARGPARRRCAGGSTSSCRRGCGRWAPSAPPRSRPGPPSAGRSTPRSPPCRSSRGCSPATGWPVPTTVCLVAEPRRTSRAGPARGGHDARPARPAPPARCSPGCCRSTARGSGRPGGPPSRTPSWPVSPRSAPLHRVPEHAVPPADVDELAGAARRLPPARGRRSRRGARGRAARGAWQLTVPLPFAERAAAAAHPLGRRPRDQRRRTPAGRSGSTRCCVAAR